MSITREVVGVGAPSTKVYRAPANLMNCRVCDSFAVFMLRKPHGLWQTVFKPDHIMLPILNVNLAALNY
jgi:hypothetical protein